MGVANPLSVSEIRSKPYRDSRTNEWSFVQQFAQELAQWTFFRIERLKRAWSWYPLRGEKKKGWPKNLELIHQECQLLRWQKACQSNCPILLSRRRRKRCLKDQRLALFIGRSKVSKSTSFQSTGISFSLILSIEGGWSRSVSEISEAANYIQTLVAFASTSVPSLPAFNSIRVQRTMSYSRLG